MTDVEKIAASLSEAQRRAVRLADARLAEADELTRMGLVGDTRRYLVGWSTITLTPLGEQVRSHLLAGEKQL